MSEGIPASEAMIKQAEWLTRVISELAEYMSDDDANRTYWMLHALETKLRELPSIIETDMGYSSGGGWFDGTDTPPTVEEMRNEYYQMSGGREELPTSSLPC